MTPEEQRHEEEYLEAMRHDQEMNEAAKILMSQGWLVIPPEDIGKYIGKYKIIPDCESNMVNYEF